jgi:hypothetical protein
MFRRLLRFFMYAIAALLLIAACGLAYLFLALPRAATPEVFQAPRTPERLARGEYLSRHVAGCSDCHGKRDWTKYSAPQMREFEGHGGTEFKLGIGTMIAPNLTPAKLESWTDGEILRAMTSGVSKDGSPLFPFMPYENYREMSREDAEAIIAYIRTWKPAAKEVPRSRLDFPLNLIVRTLPSPAPALREKTPDPSNQVEYGKYLTTIGACIHCHTKIENGARAPGMDFAGGMRFEMQSGGEIYSANITPDPETGIGRWTEAQFVDRFKSVANADEASLALNGRKNTEMPWRDYGGMKSEDLTAIFAYLRTLPPVRHAVPR